MVRLISYLAPSIPAGFFELVAKVIRDRAHMDVRLEFDDRISGPLPGDENPFRGGAVDIGFVCAPTYRWLRGELDLLPVPVPADPRAQGHAVYFSDVVTLASSSTLVFEDLRGGRWAYNDKNSFSGWFSMLHRIAPRKPEEFFSQVRHAGSHLESLRLVGTGHADAAAIDSNVLANQFQRDPSLASALRIIESWGPFPIQPTVIRADLQAPLKQSIRDALLGAHEVFADDLRSFGFLRFVEAQGADYHP